MSRARSLLLTLLIALSATSAFAQDAEPDLAELWRVGSLWQVGDNRGRVDQARKAIIAAGDKGLKFALTKLSVSSTLEIRCLNAVFAGFGEKAYADLVNNIANDDPNARRNVADLLARLDNRKAAEPLLSQARGETDLGAKLSQLAALSKWQNEEAVALIVEISGDRKDRIRHRATSLLGEYSTPEAVNRLIEMLDDDIYYVRNGAQDALVNGSIEARGLCLQRLRDELGLPDAEQNLQRLRLLLPIVAGFASDNTPVALQEALAHESGGVRAEAAEALASWKQRAGIMHDLDVDALLKTAIDKEYDPFAKAAMQKARARLGEVDTK